MKAVSSTKETEISPRVFLYVDWIGVDVWYLYDLNLELKFFEQLKATWVFFYQQAKMDWLFLSHCYQLKETYRVFYFTVSLFSLQKVALLASFFSIDGMYTGLKSLLALILRTAQN